MSWHKHWQHAWWCWCQVDSNSCLVTNRATKRGVPGATQSAYKRCLSVHFCSGWRRFTSAEVNLTHTPSHTTMFSTVYWMLNVSDMFCEDRKQWNTTITRWTVIWQQIGKHKSKMDATGCFKAAFYKIVQFFSLNIALCSVIGWANSGIYRIMTKMCQI